DRGLYSACRSRQKIQGTPESADAVLARAGTPVPGVSAPAVVPGEAVLPAPQRAPARHDGLRHEPEKLAPAVEPQLAVAGAKGMAVQNHDGSPVAASQALQAPEQVDLFARVLLLAEAARLAERRRLAEDERPRCPLVDPAHGVPDSGHERDAGMRILVRDGATAGETSRADGIGCFEKKLDAGIGIGIHEKDPIAAGAGGAGIARPADLVDRLEYDLRSHALRDLRRAVGRIVVAHDQLGLPAEPSESFHGGANAGERAGQQPLFVERGNDDGDLHFLAPISAYYSYGERELDRGSDAKHNPPAGSDFRLIDPSATSITRRRKCPQAESYCV